MANGQINKNTVIKVKILARGPRGVKGDPGPVGPVGPVGSVEGGVYMNPIVAALIFG